MFKIGFVLTIGFLIGKVSFAMEMSNVDETKYPMRSFHFFDADRKITIYAKEHAPAYGFLKFEKLPGKFKLSSILTINSKLLIVGSYIQDDQEKTTLTGVFNINMDTLRVKHVYQSVSKICNSGIVDNNEEIIVGYNECHQEGFGKNVLIWFNQIDDGSDEVQVRQTMEILNGHFTRFYKNDNNTYLLTEDMPSPNNTGYKIEGRKIIELEKDNRFALDNGVSPEMLQQLDKVREQLNEKIREQR